MMRQLFCTFALLLGVHSLPALEPGRPLDQYQLQSWSVREGMPSDFVSGVAEDSAGFWWIGTIEGLVRFDGQRMVIYNRENVPQLRSPASGQPVVDRNGVIWFATRRGLGRIADGKWEVWGQSKGLSDEAVRSIRLDQQGVLWIGTHMGVDRLENGQIRHVPGVPKDDVQSLEVDPDGTVWVGTNSGLVRIKDGAAVRYTAANGLPGTLVYALRRDSNGNLWVGADKGLALYRDGVLERVKQIPETFQRHIFEDRNKDLWFSTDEGLYRLRSGSWSRLGPEHGLGDKRIRSTFEDREGNLWIGTFAGGMSVLKDSLFETYSKAQGLIDDSVWAVFEDSRGRVWAGTNDGVSYLDRGQIHSLHRRDGLSNERIGALGESADGAIWIDTAKGLNRWDNGRIRVFTKQDGLPDDNILTLFRDRAGQLWAGTVAGAARFDGRRFLPLTTADGLAGNLVRSISEDAQGTLWFGTGRGVSAYRDGKFTNYSTKSGFPQDAVMAVLVSPEGSVWVSTVAGGLSRLRDGKVFNYGPPQGVPAQTPYQIVIDPAGALWMSNSRGIYRADRDSLNAVAEGRAAKVAVQQFGMAEGMRPGGCNGGSQPAAWAGKDGRVWMATPNGIAAIGQRQSQPLLAPRSLIEGMSAGGQPVALTSQLALPPTNTKVSFSYTAPVLRGQPKLAFQYRLTGQDADWTDAGDRREAFYTNLSPGDYRFQVRARIGELPWGPPTEALGFTLKPWFYQSTWFYAICAFLLAGSLFAAHRVRLQVLQRRYESVLAERERISRELHDSLMQGFIGASLQVQAATRLLPTSPAVAAERLKRAHSLMNESIREARDAVTDLRTPGSGVALVEGLQRIAQEIAQSGAARIVVQQEGDLAPCPDSVRWAILRIGREAMANAVRHANPNEVRVILRCENRQLQMEIQDDGCGFAPHQARGAAEGHWGLAGMRERAAQCRGALDIESTPGSGTRLVATIPLEA